MRTALKRFLAMVMAICLLLSLFCFSASAAGGPITITNGTWGDVSCTTSVVPGGTYSVDTRTKLTGELHNTDGQSLSQGKGVAKITDIEVLGGDVVKATATWSDLRIATVTNGTLELAGWMLESTDSTNSGVISFTEDARGLVSGTFTDLKGEFWFAPETELYVTAVNSTDLVLRGVCDEAVNSGVITILNGKAVTLDGGTSGFAGAGTVNVLKGNAIVTDVTDGQTLTVKLASGTTLTYENTYRDNSSHVNDQAYNWTLQAGEGGATVGIKEREDGNYKNVPESVTITGKVNTITGDFGAEKLGNNYPQITLGAANEAGTVGTVAVKHAVIEIKETGSITGSIVQPFTKVTTYSTATSVQIGDSFSFRAPDESRRYNQNAKATYVYNFKGAQNTIYDEIDDMQIINKGSKVTFAIADEVYIHSGTDLYWNEDGKKNAELTTEGLTTPNATMHKLTRLMAYHSGSYRYATSGDLSAVQTTNVALGSSVEVYAVWAKNGTSDTAVMASDGNLKLNTAKNKTEVSEGMDLSGSIVEKITDRWNVTKKAAVTMTGSNQKLSFAELSAKAFNNLVNGTNFVVSFHGTDNGVPVTIGGYEPEYKTTPTDLDTAELNDKAAGKSKQEAGLKTASLFDDDTAFRMTYDGEAHTPEVLLQLASVSDWADFDNGYGQVADCGVYYKVNYQPYLTFEENGRVYYASGTDLYAEAYAAGAISTDCDLNIYLGNNLTGNYQLKLGKTGNNKGLDGAGSTADDVEYGNTSIVGYASETNAAVIKNAGKYTVSVVVPYQYSYQYENGVVGNGVVQTAASPDNNNDTFYYFREFTFTLIVEQADLSIDRVTDTVSSSGTTVHNHRFTRNVEGKGGEEVYGHFTYTDKDQSKSVTTAKPQVTGIEWSFDIYSNNANGKRNSNNYLDESDKEDCYHGENGVLLLNGSGADGSKILVRSTDLAVTAYAQAEQLLKADNDQTYVDGSKTAAKNLPAAVVGQAAVSSVFGEDFGVSAKVLSKTEHDTLGWRVKSGDLVNGAAGFNVKVTSAESLPAADSIPGALTEAEAYDLMFAEDAYNGDLYFVSIKDAEGNEVRSWSYVDGVASDDQSEMLFNDQTNEVYDGLTVGDYTVTVDYMGLYYTSDSSAAARNADWDGGEEFNWVVATKTFDLKVEKRDVAFKTIDDVNKTYDGTALAVRDAAKDEQGNVPSAQPYVISLTDRMDSAATQFEKEAGAVLYNYLQPEDYAESYNTELALELAGTYASRNVGVQTVTDVKVRLNETDDSGNYNIITLATSSDVLGTITSANMKVTHKAFGTVVTYSTKPMRDVLGLHVKAYLPKEMAYDAEDGFLSATPTEFVETELREADDVTNTRGVYPTTGEADYYAAYELIVDEFSETLIKHDAVPGYAANNSGYRINEKTGKVATEDVAISSGNTSNASQFLTVKLSLSSYTNFTVVTEDANAATYPTAVYGACEENEGVLSHSIRYCIVGNEESYDVILPVNTVNTGSHDSSFVDADIVGEIKNGNESYKYVTVYENGDSTRFSFTVPQNSYLTDLCIVAFESVQPSEEEMTMVSYADLQKQAATVTSIEAISNGTTTNLVKIGSFASPIALGEGTYEGSVQLNETNPLYLRLVEVNGKVSSPTTLETANKQLAGSTFTFELLTGESELGTKYNVVVVPVCEEYELLNKTDYVKGAEASRSSAANAVAVANGSMSVKYAFNYDVTETEITLAYNEPSATTGAANGGTAHTITVDGAVVLGANQTKCNVSAYSSFFKPEYMIPGTVVTVTVETYRDGQTTGKQTTVDADAADVITYKWTVTDDDYYKLFGSKVIIFMDGNIRLGYGIINGASSIDFTKVTFVSVGGVKTFNNDMKAYSRYGYNVYAWYTDALLQNAVTLTGDPAVNLAVTGGKCFWLKTTYIGNGSNNNTGTTTGGTTAAKYSIVCGEGVTANMTTAKAGATVTLTLKEGYENISVKDAKGNSIALSGTRFVMPASDVVITAAKKAAEETTEPETEKVNILELFNDVQVSWYYDAVEYCVNNKLMQGVGEGKFAPAASTSRAMICTMLARLDGADVDGKAGAKWYEAAMQWAVNAGVSDGSNPTGNITREQLACMLFRFAGSKGYDVTASASLSSFGDYEQVSGYAVEAMQWAVGAGIINGSDGNLLPRDGATRAQVAAMMMRFCETFVK